jgi:hypothetical protein
MKILTKALAGIAVAIGLGFAVLTSASATPTTDRPTTLDFAVQFRPLMENYVDLGTAGFSVGDLLVFQDTLLDQKGATVGTQGGFCTITAVLPDGFQTHCVGTASLPEGQISFQGLTSNAPVKPLAVTGGTGTYQSATGDLILTENGDDTGTLRIRLNRGYR